MQHELVFLSGLPRSGSTVLTSLLNQHPDLYATTTSPVLGMIINFYNNWEPQTITQLKDKNEQQRDDMVSGLLKNAHAHFNKPIIIDKCRGWPREMKLLEKLLGKKSKFIITVRDIPSILSSFVTLANKTPDNNFIDNYLKETGFKVNNTNRCRFLWRAGVVGESWKALMSGYQYDRDQMLLLTYEDIVQNPLDTMKKVEDFLGIKHYNYDVDNLKSMDEKDEFHGMVGLHNIRPKLQKISKPPEQIIGKVLTDHYKQMNLEFWKQG